MKILRVILIAVALALGVGALGYNAKSQEQAEFVHPDDDQQFSELISSGNKPSQIDITWRYAGLIELTPLQEQYLAAVNSYERAISQAEAVASEHRDKRDLLAGWAVVFGALFSISLLPWAKWTNTVFRSTKVVADEAAKLAVHGAEAVKAMTDPSPIVGRSGLKSYSVADELSKWSKLYEDGLVTEEEFEHARSKLLKREV